MQDLNALYRREPALYQADFDPAGFEWIDCNDHEASTIALVRRAANPADWLLAVLNWTPVARTTYRVGVPEAGYYAELLNSDAGLYAGSNVGNEGGRHTDPVAAHGHAQSLLLTIPPLGAVILKKT